MCNFAFAKIHEFETTHLKSRAGAGVAGIFMEESAFLNPASLAFFQSGNVYLQRNMLEFKDSDGNITHKPKATAVVLSDGNPNLSGSLSYITQEENNTRRKRWGLSTSAPLDRKSAFGVSVRKTKDENIDSGSTVDYYQTVLGVTHAIDASTSMGVVAYDAFNSKGDETKAMIGVQHIFVDYVTLALDLAANYQAEEIADTLIYRGGLQVRVLDDFYLRFGAFNDKEREEKGNGFGLAWVQPRLGLEFAIKNTKQKANLAQNRAESKLKEAAFSVSLRF